ncbi:antitoxin VbhA family protein [Kribbella endophytica]
MTYEPCRYARQWPELFEPLDDAQKQRVSDVLASGRLDGWEPDREDVSDLVDRELGRIDAAEYIRRTIAKVTGRSGATEGRA